jgi:hypothetical protein
VTGNCPAVAPAATVKVRVLVVGLAASTAGRRPQ